MNESTDDVPGMPGDICPLLIGAQLPRVTLTNVDGEACDIRTMIARKSVILVVYRGGW